MSLKDYFNWVAKNDSSTRRCQRHFHRQLAEIHRHVVPEGQEVLELGCRDGTLLKALKPSRGVGVDFSETMIDRAREQAPECQFDVGDVSQPEAIPDGPFDFIIMSYLAGYLEDIQKTLELAQEAAHPRTRLVVSSLNWLWVPLLRIAQAIRFILRQPASNWLTAGDLVNLLDLSGWETVQVSTEQLLPFNIPLITPFCNKFLARLPVFNQLGLTILIVARPKRPPVLESDTTVSVIVPARNESGNIRAALERIPVMGKGTEVVFVEGNSTDDTWEAIQRETQAYDGPLKVSFCQQSGKGKWDAVFTGFSRAVGDILVIQDGDLTAPPEDLPKFYNAIARGDAEFANGSRLVYPMEDRAMRLLNFFGNKFFALALSFILRQQVKDSLCGTKMLLRSDYEKLLKRIERFGDFDPFGDFNLLFGSALMHLKISDIPVRYRDRSYGETNISRFRHGFILLKMTWFGLRHLRFH